MPPLPLYRPTSNHPDLCSRCPNHLNLPRLTTSATLCTDKRLYKSTLRFLSFSNTLHIISPSSTLPFQTSLVVRMSNWPAEIDEWTGSNRLKLNPSKKELIWLGSSRRLEHCPVGELNIAGVPIKPATHVLGVMIDNDLSLQVHINHVTRTCFYHLRQLRVVRRSLTTDTAHSLVRALVHSRLD